MGYYNLSNIIKGLRGSNLTSRERYFVICMADLANDRGEYSGGLPLLCDIAGSSYTTTGSGTLRVIEDKKAVSGIHNHNRKPVIYTINPMLAQGYPIPLDSDECDGQELENESTVNVLRGRNRSN